MSTAKIAELAKRADRGTNGAHYPAATQEQLASSATASRPSAPVFRIWTPEEIWKPLEPPDYLVDGLFVRGSLELIVAYGSSLKTWTLEDLGLAVASGSKWLQRFQTKKAEALLIDFESGSYELRRRAHRIARGREYSLPVTGFAFVSMPAMCLAEDDFFAALRPLAERYGFIGIDSLAAGSGGIDENDARFATSLQRLKAIAAETGCVIVVLHHSRKGGGEDVDPREMVRGSSAIFNACDVVLQLRRSDDSSFVVEQTKARGGKSVAPFVVRVDDIGPDASVVVGRDADEADDEGGAASDAFATAKARVVRLLGSERDLRSASEIARRVGGRKKQVLEAVRELEERRTVVQFEGVYRLSSEVK